MKPAAQILFSILPNQQQNTPKFRVLLVISRAMVIPVFLVFFSCATTDAQAQASWVSMQTNYSGLKAIDGVIDKISQVDDTRSEVGLTGKFSHSVVFQPASKGANAVSRPGYLHAAVGSSIFYSGDISQPKTYYDCGGNAGGMFGDTLKIREGSFGSLPESVLVRVSWRVSGSMAYRNHNPEADVHGGTGYIWTCGSTTGVSRTGGLGPREGNTYGGQPSQSVITEDMYATTPGSGTEFPLNASVDVNSGVSASFGIPTPHYGEADTFVNLELLSIEVIDPATNKHLAVTVTSASGHSYPIVQPSVPGVALGITSMVIDRDLGKGFLSFSAPSSGNYRVKGGADLANLQSWQELAVVAGSPGVNIANWNDPAAITQPSRFYLVEKLDE